MKISQKDYVAEHVKFTRSHRILAQHNFETHENQSKRLRARTFLKFTRSQRILAQHNFETHENQPKRLRARIFEPLQNYVEPKSLSILSKSSKIQKFEYLKAKIC